MKTITIKSNLINIISYSFAGIIGVGALLGSISNAVTLINDRVTYIGSGIAILIYLLVEISFRNFFFLIKLKDDKKEKNISKPGLKFKMTFVGIIILLWIPRIFEIDNNQLMSGKYNFYVNGILMPKCMIWKQNDDLLHISFKGPTDTRGELLDRYQGRIMNTGTRVEAEITNEFSPDFSAGAITQKQLSHIIFNEVKRKKMTGIWRFSDGTFVEFEMNKK